MMVLRHEEFEEGCKATCNGPYDGKWSKTMIGYGSETNHFVLELTYNYSVGAYQLGNDLEAIEIESMDIFENCRQSKLAKQITDDVLLVCDPDGHNFRIRNCQNSHDPVRSVILRTNDLEKTKSYWLNLLGMSVISESTESCSMSFGSNQCQLVWEKVDEVLRRGTGFGRIAFSIPTARLRPLQEKIIEEKSQILTALVQLDTPGKASVHVVILADPNEHEICFVGEEGFDELSMMDSNARSLLNEAIDKDTSEEWYKTGKPTATGK